MILESFIRKIIRHHFERQQKAPAFLNGFGEFVRGVPVPHPVHFYYEDPETGLRLTGAPDDLFLMADHSFTILDYKSARWNENQSAMLPLHQVQLNSYALIAEENGYNPVSQLGLVYFEPLTVRDRDIESAQDEAGFRLSFEARTLSVDLDSQQVRLFLQQARQLMELKDPPQAREGCRDCQLLEALMVLNPALSQQEENK
jgi:hypothetical protein